MSVPVKKDPLGVEVLNSQWASYALNDWEKYEKNQTESSREFRLRCVHYMIEVVSFVEDLFYIVWQIFKLIRQ